VSACRLYLWHNIDAALTMQATTTAPNLRLRLLAVPATTAAPLHAMPT
jgi:hypothetical protein